MRKLFGQAEVFSHHFIQSYLIFLKEMILRSHFVPFL